MLDAAWGLPWSVLLVVSTLGGLGRSKGIGLGLSLCSVLAGVWLQDPAWAECCFLLALGIGLSKGGEEFEEALLLPTIVLILLRARLAWMPVMPEKMAVWGALAALVGVCMAGQGLVAASGPQGRARSLLAGQGAWAAFGIFTGTAMAPLAWTGTLGLLWQQPLLRQPLGWALRREQYGAWSTALLFLGLGGCLGLSGFSAYFQLFVPLMGEAAAGAMHAKLGESGGWLAAVAMLAVLVQTLAFGYFYRLHVLPKADDQASASGAGRTWIWLALGLSLVWAFQVNTVSAVALRALAAVAPRLFFLQP